MNTNSTSQPPNLPGFTFVRPIGGGGFADVFLYTQHKPSRQVAIKVLRAEHLSAEGLRQFETEADVMAEVSEHPYIVTVYTSGVAPGDGRPYIVMEHYPQPHFGVRGKGGKLPVSEVLRVSVQISSAVHTAHEASIVHRDIKPANILTSAFGRPGLTDFGIAGVRTEGVMDAAGGVTIAFAPPEVLMDNEATGSSAPSHLRPVATIPAHSNTCWPVQWRSTPPTGPRPLWRSLTCSKTSNSVFDSPLRRSRCEGPSLRSPTSIGSTKTEPAGPHRSSTPMDRVPEPRVH